MIISTCFHVSMFPCSTQGSIIGSMCLESESNLWGVFILRRSCGLEIACLTHNFVVVFSFSCFLSTLKQSGLFAYLLVKNDTVSGRVNNVVYGLGRHPFCLSWPRGFSTRKESRLIVLKNRILCPRQCLYVPGPRLRIFSRCPSYTPGVLMSISFGPTTCYHI